MIVIYGKECHVHRNIGFFSDTSEGYYFSGQLSKSKPLTSNLRVLLNRINEMHDANFNGILINMYKDGSDYIGPHSDDERFLDKQGVVSISYGATRTFRIRTSKNDQKIDFKLNNGDVVHMSGDFQKEFKHEVPKELKVKDERISFTFRSHTK